MNVVGSELQPTVSDDDPPRTVPGELNSELQYYGPPPRWRLLDLQELWRFRGLLWALAVRDLKVKYRQAVIGVAWSVLQPLATALIFVVLFGLLGNSPAAGGVPYGVFVLPGVVLWQLFAGSVAQSTGCLVANQHLIGKVYFPRFALPLAVTITALVDFAVGLVVVGVVLAAYGVVPGRAVALAPFFVGLGVVTAVAVGAWTSALNAIYRDTGFAVPFALQIGFFVSPVVYATDVLIPEPWRPLVALNPMTGALDGFRWSLFGGPFPGRSVALGVVVATAALLSGLWYFRRVEGYLADRI